MIGRCPSAVDPRPAVLADHVWLVNERGVATVEPVPGHEVHGVVWRVGDHDLAALDGFEGVPARYRRTTVTVTTTNGRLDAIAYVDPITEPGPPRDGYLELVLDGAAEHALPAHWIDHLRRWERARFAALVAERAVQPGGPTTLAELLAVDGVVEERVVRSRFGFLAIHGGELEAMTDVIARSAAAASGASYYGVLHPPGYRHHLASTRYDPRHSPLLAELLDHVDVVVSVHGYGRKGFWTDVLAGGSHRALATHVGAHLERRLPGYRVVTELEQIPRELRGLHRDNPVNRPVQGGVQLELPPRVRGTSPRSPKAGPDGVSPIVRDLVDALAAAARTWPGHTGAS